METSTWKRILRLERAIVDIVTFLNQAGLDPELLGDLHTKLRSLLEDVEQLT